FGGKLVYFASDSSTAPQTGDYPQPRIVHITQVVTEPELLKKSEKLESSLVNGNLIDFCQSKADASQTEQERITWNFLQATFNSAPRSQMLSLLGYNYEKVVSEVSFHFMKHFCKIYNN
ncbi:hypothetical protein AVEN_47280-1, partial [Araneus ventricosus]